MKPFSWIAHRAPAHEDRVWELYHENSKRRAFELELRTREGRFGYDPTLKTSLEFTSAPEFQFLLTDVDPSQHLTSRGKQDRITLPQLAHLLLSSYGTLDKEGSVDRPIYSEGSRWPVELFLWHPGDAILHRGLYYFNADSHTLNFIRLPHDAELILTDAITIDKEGIVVFITAMFNRITIYFGERGYRYACMESGQVIGNLRHRASELGLQSEVVLEFHDRALNDFLRIDGIEHAVLAIVSIIV